MGQLARAARRRQSELELERLADDVQAWLEHRRARDRRSQYETQLNAIESLVDGAVTGLRRILMAIDVERPALDVYGECRAFDLRVAWLRRVWQFFREKFDQRDDPALQALLTAADEVVWSCYRQVVERATVAGINVLGPAPLPYIEPYYSPEAFPAELIPAGLKTEIDIEFAREHLNRLPIPVVRLQPACVSAPWWLVYLGHEVGHQVQYSLLDEMRLVGAFRLLVEETVTAAGAAKADAEVWGRWSREIFADICSVLFMGQWALWAMVELELQAATIMTRRRSAYPAPAVRLLLLRETATALELEGQEPLRDLDLDDLIAQDPVTLADAALVPQVVAAALGFRGGADRTLKQLTGFAAGDFNGKGDVELWSGRLRGEGEPVPEGSLRLPRLLASAGLAAWAQIDGDPHGKGRELLATRLVDLVARSGPEGTREGRETGADPQQLGEELAELLGNWEPET